MQVIDIGEVIILDKNQADSLLLLGFKYTKRNINNKEVFILYRRMNLCRNSTQNLSKVLFLCRKIYVSNL